MAILQPVKPGLSAPIVTSIPDEWSKTWFRSFITNYLQNTDVRNAVTPSGGGVSVSSTGPFNPATLSLSPIPPDTVFGNVSGITAPPSALDETQLTSLIKVFSTAASGAVPKSPGGTLDFLRADGAWASAAAIAAPPSALIGLTPVDGTALTFMTSDSAPALDQSISPTWTGDHTFTQGVVLGTPVGGNLGPGTENVSNGYFVNGIRVSTNGPQGKAGRDGRDGRFIVSGASGLSPSPVLVQPAFGPQPKRAQDGHAGRIGPPGASTSAGGGVVSSVTGTANQITASPTTGAVVLSFPANLLNTTPSSGIAVEFESAVTGSTSATAVLLVAGIAGASASQFLFGVQQNGFSVGFQVSTNGTNMQYGFNTGNVTIGAPNSGDALSVSGAANSYAVFITAASTTGQSLGLIVRGGTNSADAALAIQSQSGILTFFEIFGDGHGALGPSTTSANPGFTWTTGAAFTINTPTSGTPLTVNGTNGATVLALASTSAASTLISGYQAVLAGAWSISSQSTDGFALGTDGAASLQLFTNSSSRVTVGSAGNVTISAPSSGAALQINAVDTSNALIFNDTSSTNGIRAVFQDSVQIRGLIGNGPEVFTGAAVGDFGIAANGGLLRLAYAGGTTALSINTSGAVSIAAPSGGVALTATAISGQYAVQLAGSAVSGNSFGLVINAGTTAADVALRVTNQNGTANLLEIFGDGGIVIGAATSGDEGLGSINAQSYYLNGLLQTITLVTNSAETRTSTTTQTNSTSLTYAIPVAGKYAIRLVAYFTSIGTGGFAMGVNYSGSFTGTSSYIVYEECNNGANASILTGEVSSTPTAIVSDNSIISTTTPVAIIVTATLTATGTGTLAMSFAQDVSNTSASTLNIGSYMQVTRIA
jgi:hypothetical protein